MFAYREEAEITFISLPVALSCWNTIISLEN